METNGEPEPSESKHRWQLALVITILSIVGIAFVSTLAISHATDKAVTSQSVLTAVLPLLAAWVSTVLAYYYSSEGLEAATRSVKQLLSTDEKLKTILVRDKMIKFKDMVFFLYTDALKVQEIQDKLKSSAKGYRYPFLDNKNLPQFMIHKSALDEALIESLKAGKDLNQLTIKDLFDSMPDFKILAGNSFGVVAEDATLADAKAEMARAKNAQDVFVTATGHKDSAVSGWITNRIIEESSKV